MVLFTADWCASCVKLLPVWEQLANKTSKEPNIRVGLIDIDKDPELKYQLEIYSVPTILLILDNKYYTFEANATLKNLTRFAKREYKASEANPIKPPKDKLGKILFTAKVNLAGFVTTLDHLGFDFLPDFVKKFMVLIFLLLPILAALACVWFTQEAVKPKGEPEEQKAEEKKQDWMAKAKSKKTQ